MSMQRLIVLGVLELISILVIALMWAKHWHTRRSVRVIWSVVLLVPVIGVISYFFLRENPDEHPYDADTTSGSAVGDGGDGGYH